MTKQEQLAQWVESHGFTVRRLTNSDYIEIEIPYTDKIGSGIDKQIVSTVNEAREVLGY